MKPEKAPITLAIENLLTVLVFHLQIWFLFFHKLNCPLTVISTCWEKKKRRNPLASQLSLSPTPRAHQYDTRPLRECWMTKGLNHWPWDPQNYDTSFHKHHNILAVAEGKLVSWDCTFKRHQIHPFACPFESENIQKRSVVHTGHMTKAEEYRRFAISSLVSQSNSNCALKVFIMLYLSWFFTGQQK